MHDFDDDQLISGAFDRFNREADPAVRPAGSAAVRGLAAKRRRSQVTMLSALAALVIAAPVATYAALGQDNQGPPVPGGTPSVTAPATPTPGVTVRAFTHAYFAMWADNESARIHSVGTQTRELASTIDTDPAIFNTISISPDGTKLAWIDKDNDLLIANVDGSGMRVIGAGEGGTRRLARNQDPDGRVSPVWTPDSVAIITSTATYEVETGAIIGPAAEGSYLRWSANGEYRAYLLTDGDSPRIVVRHANGIVTGEVALSCLAECESAARAISAVSDDGRYVATDSYPTNRSRATGWQNVIDMSSGKELELTLPAPNSGRFLPDGRFLLATPTELRLMDLTGKVSQTYPLPDELHRPGPSSRVVMLSVN